MHLWFKICGSVVLAVVSLSSPTRLTAQEAPRFGVPRVLTNKELALTLTATSGPLYRIEATTNLTGWAPLVTLPGATTLQHTDSATPYLRHSTARLSREDS